MASVSSQPQFRYTQPPSKVLPLRNLPWECTKEELIELRNHFGKVVNTKCNVGANKIQSFIKFADLSQSIAMISYYASSSIPLKYGGNVFLVTIEGDEARQVSIEVLHLAKEWLSEGGIDIYRGLGSVGETDRGNLRRLLQHCKVAPSPRGLLLHKWIIRCQYEE